MPHDLECEAGILGGIILNNEALAMCPDLEVDDFYDLRHRVVFTAMRNLEAEQKPIDIVLLESEISRIGKLEALGGVGYLGQLTLRVPTADNVEHYANVVRRHRVTRDVVVMLNAMIDEALGGLSEGEQLVHDVSTALMMIKTGGEVPMVTMAELIAREALAAVKDYEAKASGEMIFTGVPTGVTALDDRVGGSPRELMTLWIGRPGMGKSTIAMKIASSSKELADEESAIASYEDSGQSFGQRGLAQESGLATDLIRARRLQADDIIEIAAQAKHSRRTELLLSCSGMTVEALARRVRRENLRRRASGRKPLARLVVDYLQKMPLPERARSRDDGISHISATLCNIAVAEKMAVDAMCQLNREVEKRDDHRPRLSDIRDSGSLEQDGKLIIGLYHPWSYDHDKYPDHEHHLLVLKNHQGESHGDILMFWDRKRHAIYNTQLEYQQARALRGYR